MPSFHRKTFFIALAVFFIILLAYSGRHKVSQWFVSSDKLSATSTSIVSEETNLIPTAANIFSVSAPQLASEVKAIPRPKVPAEFRIPSRYPDFYQKDLAAKIQTVVSILDEYPYNFHAWNSLAIYSKSIDDFQTARKIWEYLLAVSPGNPIFLANLGELYQTYVKDYEKSESYYLEALKSDPTKIEVYKNLHELYKFLYKKDTEAAFNILKTGIAANTESVDLLVMLANDYKDIRDFQNARAYFKKALAAAKGNNDLTRAKQIEIELRALP